MSLTTTDSNIPGSGLAKTRDASIEKASKADLLARIERLPDEAKLIGEAALRAQHADSTNNGYDRAWVTFAEWCKNESSRVVSWSGLGVCDPLDLIPEVGEADDSPWKLFEEWLILFFTTEYTGLAPEDVGEEDYEEWLEDNPLRAPSTINSTLSGIKARLRGFQPDLKWEPSERFIGTLTGIRRKAAEQYGAPRQATPLLLGHVEHISEWLLTNTEPMSLTADRLIFEYLVATGGNRAAFARFTVDCVDEGGERMTDDGVAYFPAAIRTPGRMRNYKNGLHEDKSTRVNIPLGRYPRLKAALDAWMRVRPTGDGHILDVPTTRRPRGSEADARKKAVRTGNNPTQRVNNAIKTIERSTGVTFHANLTLNADDMKKVREHLSSTGSMNMLQQRDHTMLLVGFFGALRRAELCALTIGDITFTQRNKKRVADVLIQRSKTDQEATGQRVYLYSSDSTAPHAAVVDVLANWMAVLNEQGCSPTDPLFPALEGDTIKRTGKRNAATPVNPKHWSERLNRYAADSEVLGGAITDPTLELQYDRVRGHSLRRGFVTTAVLQGVDSITIAKQTRHKNVNMIAAYADSLIAAQHDWAEALFGTPVLEEDDEPDVEELEAEIKRLKAELEKAS
jgi:hypothetical protein